MFIKLLIVKFIFIIVGNNINVTSEKVLMLLFGLLVKYDIKLEEYQYYCLFVVIIPTKPPNLRRFHRKGGDYLNKVNVKLGM